ncbi:hypothetical protein A2U01_0073250, partial [Trifolium medium]|nr:hypothetical protein [Trifolium medium]
ILAPPLPIALGVEEYVEKSHIGYVRDA